MKNKYGEENVLEEICPKCSKKFKCFSAGIYEDESGMMQCYVHFYIYLQIGIYSDLAMLCYYKVFLFQNAISHMFYSNFPSFTPSIFKRQLIVRVLVMLPRQSHGIVIFQKLAI